MKKILVATDFSTNSKKAIRFAMQLASQNNYKLVFYNVIDVTNQPNAWDTVYSGSLNTNEISINQEKLENLISKIHRESKLTKIRYECNCEVAEGPFLNVGNHIMEYAEKIKASYICVSTNGSGTISKLFGSTASALILKSTIPLFVIPKNYIQKEFSSICYASDIENIDSEIKKVVELADSLESKITVLHYDYDSYLKLDKEKLNIAAKKYESEKIFFEYKKLNPKYTINYHIRKDVLFIKPSLVVLFTKQNRNWFDRLFETHHSSNMSFNTKVPLLIFRKKEK